MYKFTKLNILNAQIYRIQTKQLHCTIFLDQIQMSQEDKAYQKSLNRISCNKPAMLRKQIYNALSHNTPIKIDHGSFLTGMHFAVISGDAFCADFAHLKRALCF